MKKKVKIKFIKGGKWDGRKIEKDKYEVEYNGATSLFEKQKELYKYIRSVK